MTSTQPEPARRVALDEPNQSWDDHAESRPARAFPELAEQLEPVVPEIGTLAPVDLVHDLKRHRTGEPRRPWSIRLGSGFCFAAVVNQVLALLWLYWSAIPVPIDNFAQAAWLLGIVPAEPGSAMRVILVSAATLITLLAVIPLTITGYYSWQGYRWSRVSALISLFLSLGALSLNLAAWPAIGLAAIGAVLLWLPQGKGFFAAWQALRHPEPTFAPPTGQVRYGPVR